MKWGVPASRWWWLEWGWTHRLIFILGPQLVELFGKG